MPALFAEEHTVDNVQFLQVLIITHYLFYFSFVEILPSVLKYPFNIILYCCNEALFAIILKFVLHNHFWLNRSHMEEN